MILDDLIRFAYIKKASDIHITAGIPAMVRINGILTMVDQHKLTPAETEDIIAISMGERAKTQYATTGQADYSYSVDNVGRCRVNVFKQRGSMAAVLRLISEKIPSPQSLGIPDSVVDLTARKRGLVLVTGPTGSGKSTTLASLIDIINHKRNEHIITLEDPIEYMHRHKRSIVNQREIGPDTCDYGAGLRAALREDPDVILVGEMRDLDTISTAITAAETGHLVFSTLHTIGAAPTIDRIIDVFPPHQQGQIRIQLGAVLECVVSQQLMPLSNGQGRVAAFEVMHANAAIRNLIREGKTHMIPAMIQTNRKLGMVTMDDSLMELYRQRKISTDTAISFAQDPINLAKKLS